MGDIVTLVEKAAATIDAEKAARVAEKMRRGVRLRPARATHADAADGRHGRPDGHAAGHRQDEESARGREPRRACAQAPGGDHRFHDPAERRNPDLLKASRKKRVAAGSGTKVEDVNRMLKMHRAHGRCDEGDGQCNKRSDGRACQDARDGRRNAEPGGDGSRSRCRAGCLCCRARPAPPGCPRPCLVCPAWGRSSRRPAASRAAASRRAFPAFPDWGRRRVRNATP